MKKYFNKLVRDKIPDIILNSGKTCVFETLDDDSYITQLDLKLVEECNEVLNARSSDHKVEELADVLEVIYSIAENMGVELGYLESVRVNKKLKNGGFNSRVFLKEVSNDD